MLNTNQMPPWMFNLEGTFLGFDRQNSEKPKSIVLEVEEEQMTIKLPKKLRNALEHPLKLGDRIRCIGRSQLHLDLGVVKLEAYYLFPLSPAPEMELPLPSPSVANRSLNKAVSSLSPSDSNGRTLPVRQKQGKILVCKKSSCQKRGGRKLVTALKRVLKEQQIQNQVDIQYSGCQKRCSKNPSLTIMPGKHRYDRIKLENLTSLVQEHFGVGVQPSPKP